MSRLALMCRLIGCDLVMRLRRWRLIALRVRCPADGLRMRVLVLIGE